MGSQVTDRCPTCGRKHPEPAPARERRCWSCGATFLQTAGRPRITCNDPRCLARRRTYRKQGFAALDRMP